MSGPNRGLLSWAAEAPADEPDVAAAEPTATGPNGRVRRLSRRSKWFLLSSAAAAVIAAALVIIFTVAVGGPTLTPIGATVHVIQTSDYINRSADITMNSIKVASDDSLCAGSASNTLGYWVVVDVTVANTSDESIPMNTGGFGISHTDGSDAKTVSLGQDSCFPADEGLLAVSVPAGETQEVQLAIDTDTPKGILTYDPVIQDHSVAWAFPSN